ncbi:hypothetical protein [Romboutsia ilealis]|uniref:hypothetical protein n=1 Tax=Romboutsia ilealis TaxID=1115758 RepID=UPI00272D2B33|nr:hypothetical protein [Romboutsia ilealis]
MTSTDLQRILTHAGKTDDHVIGFRLANGGRVMFTHDRFDMKTNMLDGIGMLYKKLEDSEGQIAHSYTDLGEVIQVILRDDVSQHIFVRDIIE